MKWVIAVSGGVDSVALLHMMTKRNSASSMVVAHFDHGMRADSEADARFVMALADQYGIAFETRREELGSNASENTARDRRYAFLRRVAKKHHAKIVTAHHKDDLIETIAINLHRGTGWRGLAVFGDDSIIRPLLLKTKNELYEYACKHELEWVEDSTNTNEAYLRNNLRARMRNQISPAMYSSLHDLYIGQKMLRRQIDRQVTYFTIAPYSRYFFTMIPDTVASELLRVMTACRLLPAQRRRALTAIKTASPKDTMQAGNGITLHFTASEFIVENSSQLL